MAISSRHSTSLKTSTLWALLLGAPALGGMVSAPSSEWQEGQGLPGLDLENLEQGLGELLALERAEAHLSIRRGQWGAARKLLKQHLEDDPEDGKSRALLALGWLRQERYEKAMGEAERSLGHLEAGSEEAATAGRVWLRSLEELGREEGALELMTQGTLAAVLAPDRRVSDAWMKTRLLSALGQVDKAKEAALAGAGLPAETWQELLDRSRLERAAGDLVQSSRSLVEAMTLAEKGEGMEPDLLVALGEVYFESEQEVEARGKRSAGALFKKALQLHPGHADGLLGLHALHRLNRLRQSRSPESILQELLQAHPDCVRAQVRLAGDDLADGLLPRVRRALQKLEQTAPDRRDVKTLRAALSFVEHDRDRCDALLAGLTGAAPKDSTPEREVGRYLVELYRFQEALPFLEAAVARNGEDHLAWTRLGGALANVGHEDQALEAFDKAVEFAGGRQDAWRDNLRNVLNRMAKNHVRESFGPLEFSWQPDAAEVFRAYWVPFYEQAREELAQRYGFTPERTTIEVFREHGDFSVRSVGFEGFPALGVCFGPVVTCLSPLSAMRGRFSWARTGFHEFSHVVHLGLSHNRCPRWITEGLATWEEVNRNPAWTRNMRLELLDARANGQLIPVRELNRAFRGPRILFGYYQGGLLCEMLVDQHGFSPMVRLLEAFDRGADLDGAIESVFQTTPEAIDREFEAFVDGRLQGLNCEPVHDPALVRRKALRLTQSPPEDGAEKAEWMQDWITVGYSHFQQKNLVDAAEALRRANAAKLDHYRLSNLRASLAMERGDVGEAQKHWQEAYDLGGREYRSLAAMGILLQGSGEFEEALVWFQDAEKSFPGFPQVQISAELLQAKVLEQLDRKEEAMAAKERWLAYNPGEYDLHLEVARWHQEEGRHDIACGWFSRANEVDPFRRNLHLDWAQSLRDAGRWEEAMREYGVALVVPAELDLDHLKGGAGPIQITPGQNGAGGEAQAIPLTGAERAEIHYSRAQMAEALERQGEIRHHLAEALLADPDHKASVAWLARLGQSDGDPQSDQNPGKLPE